mmetsp:Transcript_14243/g.15698  ORF Transcript_14243/g.15698 Transcript_14243/m.15698 type:complete len:302 (-) Transcript_14243:270-1175(-)|eukprot:CAMPEP_0115006694 /NCGR_PEP_ID=MMETSP0216-20121206/20667_1 /TAXON_ID=223996 /ORGANISM="Protocruzia adherens, Strain Boccale" /LENGTH=301 /DNA_ID=CAMNT_0002373355 /DNA_START=72 /DNA_END=977 /DNA_ORIENTATION=-
MDTSAYSLKGQELVQKAEKKLKGGLTKIFSNKQDRLEDAASLFEQAATNFKLAKEWDQAAQAYERAAECTMKAGNMDPNFFIEAANCAKKVNNADSIKYTERGIEGFIHQGRFNQAARSRKNIAQIYEQDRAFDLAGNHYKIASEHFAMEANSESDQNQCLMKWAELSTYDETNDLVEPIKVYEEIGEKALTNNLLKHGAAGHFHKACLLNLANNDIVGAREASERYCDLDPNYASGRSYKLTEAVFKAIDDNKVESFQDTLFDYNKITPLSKWEETMFLRIKKLYFPSTGAVAGGDLDFT